MSERLDERLRRAARTYRRLGNHTAEGMFLEAADTICELQTENAKLRDGANAMRQLYEDELKHALADNAKLRELVRHMHTCVEHYEMDGTISCDRCPLDNDTGN